MGLRADGAMLLFGQASIEITDVWGGTAGDRDRQLLDLDGIEIMVVGTRRDLRVGPPDAVFV